MNFNNTFRMGCYCEQNTTANFSHYSRISLETNEIIFLYLQMLDVYARLCISNTFDQFQAHYKTNCYKIVLNCTFQIVAHLSQTLSDFHILVISVSVFMVQWVWSVNERIAYTIPYL